MAEECCFACKDGGDDLRVCDYENCLKAYHPKCIGNDDEQFICDWHKCLNCRGSSDYQCLCCPVYSVCNACIGKVKFVQLKKRNKGFCNMCLNQAILIEKNADADPDVAKTDNEDAEIGKILFKDYWEVIKDREHLSLVDLEEASALLNIRLNCEGVNSEKSPHDYHRSDGNILPDNDTNDHTIPSDSKRKQNKVNTSLKNKSNKKTYVGWASEELIEFLSSFGKDTTKPLDEPEIVGVVKGYIKRKNLYQDVKKLCFFCDDKLQPLFTRRKVRCKMIRRFLAVHLASNAVSEDEIFDGSEDDTPVVKKKPQNSLEPKITKRVSEGSKRCFASLVQNNINLIYLRRTLVVSLLSQPDTFEHKVVGCFVRFKNPFSMECYKNSPNAFMLGRVAGIKKSSKEYKINDTYTNVLLCVTGLLNDVKISELSDEDFAEDECNDLISLVKKGLLERATIAEFEEKVAAVHRDIVNHWIERELVILERSIDRAHIKGWHVEMEELLQRKKLLSTPAERQCRLEEIPEIVPDTEYEEKETELEVGTSNSSQENRAPEACFSGAILDPALHSQVHDTQDDSPTQAIDVDREEGDYSRQVVMTKDKEVDVINLDSDEDEDLPTVQHKPEGNTVHAPRAMNGGNILIEPSESASRATLHAQRGMNGDVLLEQCKSAPATMNGVLQPELRQPAPATMNGVLPPEQREPAPAAMNGPEQCEPAPAAKNGVSPHEPLWHYVDPQGDPRGPFALVRLYFWKQSGFFDEDFRVWMTGQNAKQGILLTDAFQMHL